MTPVAFAGTAIGANDSFGIINGQSYTGEATLSQLSQELGNYVRVFLVTIRRKLEPDPAHPRYFITEPGCGIRFLPSGLPQAGGVVPGPEPEADGVVPGPEPPPGQAGRPRAVRAVAPAVCE